VKGYEITPDQYVIVEPGELEAIEPRKTKTIDIEDFVDQEEIDPLFYDHPYYLMPGTGAAKPYKLLVDAMEDAQKVGIARVVIRQKEQLVALRPSNGVLAMSTMNFADEVVDPDKFDDKPDEIETSKRELDMAKQLIDSLTSEWEPNKYRDTYRERVLELIEQKAEGKEIAVQPVEEPQPVPDLMAALEASVKAARQDKPKSNGSGEKKKSGGKKPAAKTKAKAKA
jgi:DNA end-binding protein Ku